MNSPAPAFDGVVVITRNRPSYAERCIALLRRLRMFECTPALVVDDADASQMHVPELWIDGVMVVNRSNWLRSDLRAAVQQLRGSKLDLGLPGWNTPNARNIGQLHAAWSGWKNVLFLDDDIIPSADPITVSTLRGLKPGLHALPVGGAPDLSDIDWIELWCALHADHVIMKGVVSQREAVWMLREYTNLPVSRDLANCGSEPTSFSWCSGIGACYASIGSSLVGFFPRCFDEDLYTLHPERASYQVDLRVWRHTPPKKNVLCPIRVSDQFKGNITVRTMRLGSQHSAVVRMRYIERLLGQARRHIEKLINQASGHGGLAQPVVDTLLDALTDLKRCQPTVIAARCEEEQWNDTHWSGFCGKLERFARKQAPHSVPSLR